MDWSNPHDGANFFSMGTMDPIENFIFGKKKKYSDKPYLAALDNYQRKVDAVNAQASTAYQAGEDANLANLNRSGAESRAMADQNAISRGLYNTTVPDVAHNRINEAQNQGYTAIAGERGAFLNSTKPNESIYGPLIAARAAHPDKATTKRDLGAEFDARNQSVQSQVLGAYSGQPNSAASQIAANNQNGAPASAAARGLGAVSGSLAKRGAESGAYSQALNKGASVGAIQGGLPDPSLNGALIQQIASQPVKQNGIRTAIGGILPIAGAVVGGIYGGPAGAAVGGAVGGAAGAQFGGADSNYLGQGGSNDPWAGAASGIGYGSMVSNFLKPGAANGDWASFFNQRAPQSPQTAATGPTNGYNGFSYGSQNMATGPANASYGSQDMGYGGSSGTGAPSISGGYSVYGNRRPWEAYANKTYGSAY